MAHTECIQTLPKRESKSHIYEVIHVCVIDLSLCVCVCVCVRGVQEHGVYLEEEHRIVAA